jgi:hypothetical protein
MESLHSLTELDAIEFREESGGLSRSKVVPQPLEITVTSWLPQPNIEDHLPQTFDDDLAIIRRR